ncbi:MAG: DUF3052 domain-containing protein [Gemmatimonadales bacterium]
MAQKLGIRAGAEIHVAGAPHGYPPLLAPLPEGVKFVARVSRKTDLVHVFASSEVELAKALQSYRARVNPTAMIWVSWPKKSAKVPTDITQDTVREVALPLGYVDVKVCAVTDVWSGLKLVVPKDHR